MEKQSNRKVEKVDVFCQLVEPIITGRNHRTQVMLESKYTLNKQTAIVQCCVFQFQLFLGSNLTKKYSIRIC